MPATATAPTRDDVAVIVPGEDWTGAPVPRALDNRRVLVLRGAFGEGFDLSGPHVGMCRECGELAWGRAGHGVTREMQRHYGAAHGYTPGLLP
jgi:hypothetical protein